MRLLFTEHNNELNGKMLSEFLTSKGINNLFEIDINRDWGSSEYGTFSGKVWVIEEDQFEEAARLLNQFNEMEDKSFLHIKPVAKPVEIIENTSPEQDLMRKSRITTYLVILCSLLFFISQFTTPHIPTKFVEKLPDLPLTPLLASPIREALMYDFPKAFELLLDLVNRFGLENLDNLPAQGQKLIAEFRTEPYWEGIYDNVLRHLMHPSEKLTFEGPLFEKIREGEIWRIFTPILLHGDIFHLLFNMLWLYVIGKQIEERIGKGRYVFFILIAAAFTNTLQYLMTGPNFIGISGVLCAMISYTWMRQRITPWEGYQMQRATFLMIVIFILAMFGLQIAAFLAEIYTQQTVAINIANTAHLSGLALGFLFGRMKFFARQT